MWSVISVINGKIYDKPSVENGQFLLDVQDIHWYNSPVNFEGTRSTIYSRATSLCTMCEYAPCVKISTYLSFTAATIGCVRFIRRLLQISVGLDVFHVYKDNCQVNRVYFYHANDPLTKCVESVARGTNKGLTSQLTLSTELTDTTGRYST